MLIGGIRRVLAVYCYTVQLYCLLSLHFLITSSAHKGICDVPERNVSFSSLSLPYYEGYEGTGASTKKIYISLCQPLSELSSKLSSICDAQAHVCITKLEDGEEFEYIPNAGSQSSEGLAPYLDHYKIMFDSGDSCQKDSSRNVSTRIDFFCTYPDAEDNSILYGGMLGECDHQVFWHTSLTCTPGQLDEPVPSSCVIKVPGYDAIIDLSVWSSRDGYYLARSDDGETQKRFYHLNLCKSVTNSPCPKNSVVCEVDDTQSKVIKTLANFTDTNNLSYNQENEVIRLRYPKADASTPSVNINIECDRDAVEPQITMEHLDNKTISFRFLTVAACLVPPAQCQARNSNQDVYDLSSLRIEEWEFSLADDKQTRYEIKVCGSLPVTQGNPCDGQTGICTFRYEGNTTRMVDARNLGIMYKRPEVMDNGYIRLEYSHGSAYKDTSGNSCNMSAEIILRCDDKEYGPQFEDATACHHTLTWATPAACPVKEVSSIDCTVREPLFNNLFNLTDAHNQTQDYFIEGSNNTNYELNVCKSLVENCTDSDDLTCLDTMQSLTYMDGFLELKYQGKPCPSNPNETLDARVIFTCNHESGVGGPELVSEEECSVEFNWKSSLACPPHYMVQCSVPTSKGFVDLSSLSLPHENYQVELDNGDIFVMNLCRSLVHTNQTKCPYKSASCLIKPGDVIGQNLGQVHSSLKVDREGVPYITYTLGSVCPDKDSKLTHLQTIIKFECSPGMYDSVPELLEISNCHYIFMWKHAVACPVKTTVGNCSVNSLESGFTFNLTSLYKPEGWRWNESAHHIVNHFDFNICGPLEKSGCGAGVGICDNNKRNFGLANSNLTFTNGKLELVYPGGHCPGQQDLPAETRFRFYCPPRRMGSSGNYEHDGPWKFASKRTSEMCTFNVDFYTDLACDHQVYCDVTMDNVVYPLTKLRRHDINYKMVDAEGNDFVLNICGPLVPTDVPSSGCNPQGACGFVNNRHVGLGKVQNPPTVSNDQLIIRYTEGDYCEANKGTWSSTVFFTCDPTNDQNSRFGKPKLLGINADSCEATFQMNSLLACRNITKFTKIKEPDSCQLYHAGKNKYIDLTPLRREQNYKIFPLKGVTDEYYELQPCGSLVSSCNSSICRVTPNSAVSLGNMNDVKYYPDTDELRVRYLDGFECNSHTWNNRFMTKIFYSCDPSVEGPGAPVMIEGGALDCFLLINWKSKALCEQYEIDQYERNKSTQPHTSDTTDDEPTGDYIDNHTDHESDYNGGVVINPNDDSKGDSDADTKSKAEEEEEEGGGGGSSWGFVVGIALLLCLGLYVYKSNAARDNLARILTEVRARMPVSIGGRAHRDSNFLISGYNAPSSGFLEDDDDYTMT